MKPAKEHKKHRQKRHKEHRKRKRAGAEPLEHLEALLKIAGLGDAAAAESYLTSNEEPGVLLRFFDAEGRTPLHEAARAGHQDVVQCFLRHGADARAETFRGDTPAHLAAQRGHLLVLTALLQADRPAKIDARNADGVSVQELAEKAMQAQDDDRGQAAQEQEPDLAPSERDSEAEWEQRLREEQLGEEDGGFGGSSRGWWGASDGGGWGAFGAATPADSAAESEDDYARRLWEEMERRRSRARGASEAAKAAWAPADEAAARRQANARAAEQRSRAILEEEAAKEAAWRAALQKGALGARRAAYEARWAAFGRDVAAGRSGITFGEVPWPAEDAADMQAIILYGVSGAGEVRKRLRVELLRWHEDKFARFAQRLAPGDAQRVLDRVKAVAQLLNGLSSRAQG